MEQQELPAIGETVICSVRQVLNYGAFAELPEYNNIRGFIHISNVASGWIKNIRNFVREGQVRAAKVVSINREKGQIDLSLTKLSRQDERARIEEWKQLKRGKKFIEMLAKENKRDFESVWMEIAEPLTAEFGSLQDAFQEIALKKEAALKQLPKNWHAPLLKFVEKNVVVKEKEISGFLSLSSLAPNGVELIKQAFEKVKSPKETVRVRVSYAGSGKYLLKVSSHNIKDAEKVLNSISEQVVQEIEKRKGSGKFERIN